jgi:hypothetical protein
MSEKKQEVIETSEAQIAVHWQEEGYYPPSPKFIGQANLTDDDIFRRFSLDNFPDYYTEFAELLTWYKYWDEVLDTSEGKRFLETLNSVELASKLPRGLNVYERTGEIILFK